MAIIAVIIFLAIAALIFVKVSKSVMREDESPKCKDGCKELYMFEEADFCVKCGCIIE
jgi:hypothetical protein